MFKKIKNILGIEGVKVKLDLPEEISSKDGVVKGKLIFSSQTKQRVTEMSIKLIEKYRRGRNDSKLINEYLLGSIIVDMDLTIPEDGEKTVEFELPFNKMLSEMDQLESRNFLAKALVKMAKKLKNVHSEYKVEASVVVQGTRLHPMDSQVIVLK